MDDHSIEGVYSPGFRVFSQKDVEVHNKVGEGSYGAVFKVRMRDSGRWLAVKKSTPEWYDYGLPSSLMREVAALLQVPQHPHLVALEGVLLSADTQESFLCFELLRGGDLEGRLDEIVSSGGGHDGLCGVPDAGWARHVMSGVVAAVRHLHRYGVVHRDLKSGNVLLGEAGARPGQHGAVKVCDFGLSRYGGIKGRLVSREAMTLYYRAPEVVLSAVEYGMPVDIWSLGALFFETLTGHVMFDAEHEVGLLMSVFKALGTPDEESWPGVSALPDYQPAFPRFTPTGLPAHMTAVLQAAKSPLCGKLPSVFLDLLHEMVQCDPARRVTIRMVEEHTFFLSAQCP